MGTGHCDAHQQGKKQLRTYTCPVHFWWGSYHSFPSLCQRCWHAPPTLQLLLKLLRTEDPHPVKPLSSIQQDAMN